jgi:hypothetical protein
MKALLSTGLWRLCCCCDGISYVTVEEAVFGQSSSQGSRCALVDLLRGGCSIDYIRLQIAVHRSEVEGLAFATRLLAGSANQTLTLEHLLAIRMCTSGNMWRLMRRSTIPIVLQSLLPISCRLCAADSVTPSPGQGRRV